MLAIEQVILDFIRNTYELIGWPGVIALMALESACIPVPSEIIMPFAGWMLIKEESLAVMFILLAGVYGALGNTIGSVIAYLVGMWGGRPLLERYGKYILVYRHDLEMADRWFVRSGSWSIFVSRLLPVVRTFISLPAGIARMNFVRFLVYTFIGSFIWSVGLTYGGYLLGVHWEQVRSVMRPFDPFFVIIIMAALAFYIYRHVKKARHDKG
jgi:membrane protein DedA with SNARE-associated domain